MREIKYGIWNETEKIMTYRGGESVSSFVITQNGEVWNSDNCPTDDKLIPLQFTGLKDKNGKKIYEGDIVEAKDYWGEKDYGEIYMDEKELRWSIWRFSNNGSEPLRSPFADKKIVFEIIGNIYENPELLKEKTKRPLLDKFPECPYCLADTVETEPGVLGCVNDTCPAVQESKHRKEKEIRLDERKKVQKELSRLCAWKDFHDELNYYIHGDGILKGSEAKGDAVDETSMVGKWEEHAEVTGQQPSPLLTGTPANPEPTFPLVMNYQNDKLIGHVEIENSKKIRVEYLHDFKLLGFSLLGDGSIHPFGVKNSNNPEPSKSIKEINTREQAEKFAKNILKNYSDLPANPESSKSLQDKVNIRILRGILTSLEIKDIVFSADRDLLFEALLSKFNYMFLRIPGSKTIIMDIVGEDMKYKIINEFAKTFNLNFTPDWERIETPKQKPSDEIDDDYEEPIEEPPLTEQEKKELEKEVKKLKANSKYKMYCDSIILSMAFGNLKRHMPFNLMPKAPEGSTYEIKKPSAKSPEIKGILFINPKDFEDLEKDSSEKAFHSPDGFSYLEDMKFYIERNQLKGKAFFVPDSEIDKLNKDIYKPSSPCKCPEQFKEMDMLMYGNHFCDGKGNRIEPEKGIRLFGKHAPLANLRPMKHTWERFLRLNKLTPHSEECEEFREYKHNHPYKRGYRFDSEECLICICGGRPKEGFKTAWDGAMEAIEDFTNNFLGKEALLREIGLSTWQSIAKKDWKNGEK